jgi:hypothetical protein
VSIPDLRTMHVGPDDVLVAGRVEFRDDLTVPEVEELAERIIEDLRRCDPVIGEVFLQPATTEGLTPERLANVPGPAPEEACDRRSAG